MLKIIVAFAGFWALLTSCVSAPERALQSDKTLMARDSETVREAVANAGTAVDTETAVDTVMFDPKNPPIEIYTVTMRDIQDFVQHLDDLIKAKNYDRWLELLSPEYFELINTGEFLNTVSQQPRLKSQNIILQDSRDYFLNVVVMSRTGLQVNDIEFLTMTRVMVFTINQQAQRIRIYTLDKTPDSWEIVD
jgi:hypothetical protein